jgi:hypothetical protein
MGRSKELLLPAQRWIRWLGRWSISTIPCEANVRSSRIRQAFRSSGAVHAPSTAHVGFKIVLPASQLSTALLVNLVTDIRRCRWYGKICELQFCSRLYLFGRNAGCSQYSNILRERGILASVTPEVGQFKGVNGAALMVLFLCRVDK